MVFVRQTGCARFLGLALIVVGAAVLLAYYNVIPPHISRWWPVIVIALGVLMLIQHYWNQFQNRRPAILDPNSPVIGVTPRRRAGPPIFPVIVTALGVFLLLRNLHFVSVGVLIAVVLILLGIAVLTGGFRGSFWRFR